MRDVGEVGAGQDCPAGMSPGIDPNNAESCSSVPTAIFPSPEQQMNRRRFARHVAGAVVSRAIVAPDSVALRPPPL